MNDPNSPAEPHSPDREPPAEEAETPRLRLMRRSLAAALLGVVVISLVTWWWTRDTLPAEIRLATAVEGGLYHRLGGVLAPRLAAASGRPVRLVASGGSVANQALLRSGGADLAILQNGASRLDGLLAVAPLYPDVVHVIVRAGAGVTSLAQLGERRIAVGPSGSGMAESARDVLEHYGVAAARVEGPYFTALDADPTLDAALVTTGLMNPDLRAFLASGRYELLPVRDAEALAILHPHFEPYRVPRGFYREGPPVPPADVETVAAMSFLAVPEGASPLLVARALEALYGAGVRSEVPTLLRRSDAAIWSDLPLHPEAQSFFQPFSGLGILANLMESLAALKELLFAFGAGLYLLWMRWQRLRARELEAAYRREKDHLDVFLRQTIAVERELIEVDDPQRLAALLDRVTAIKLRALEELTDETLRGDQVFAIFLQQCGDVSGKIRTRLQMSRHLPADGVADPPEPQAVRPGRPATR